MLCLVHPIASSVKHHRVTTLEKSVIHKEIQINILNDEKEREKNDEASQNSKVG